MVECPKCGEEIPLEEYLAHYDICRGSLPKSKGDREYLTLKTHVKRYFERLNPNIEVGTFEEKMHWYVDPAATLQENLSKMAEYFPEYNWGEYKKGARLKPSSEIVQEKLRATPAIDGVFYAFTQDESIPGLTKTVLWQEVVAAMNRRRVLSNEDAEILSKVNFYAR